MAKITLPYVVLPTLSKAGIPARITAINISAGSAEVTVTPSMEYGEVIVPLSGKRPRRTRGRGRQIKGYPRAERMNYTLNEYVRLTEKVKELVHSHSSWPTDSGGRKRGIKFKSSDDKHLLVFQVV